MKSVFLGYCMSVVLMVPAMPAFSGDGKGGTICCDDASGKRSCGRPIPSECLGRKYWILDGNGMIRKVVDPATAGSGRGNDLSPPQERDVRRQRERLLQAFPSLQSYDSWRDAQLADYDRQIAQIRSLMAEGGDPETLVPALERLQAERKAAAERLAAERRELEEALRAQQQGQQGR